MVHEHPDFVDHPHTGLHCKCVFVSIAEKYAYTNMQNIHKKVGNIPSL